MSIVKFNVLSVPQGAGDTLEERFAKRAGLVEQAEGFEEFQLLRPVEGTDKYLVYTRWRDEESFRNWLTGRQFAEGHQRAAAESRADTDPPNGSAGPAATGSEIWGFEVVQHVRAEPR